MKMKETLLFEEEEQLNQIRSGSKKRDINELNRKSLSADDLDEIFCQ